MPKDHAIDTQRNILCAACELFFTLGYKETTVRKIIERAGIRNGTLYHYYTGKDDIFSHLVSQLLDIVRTRAQQMTRSEDDPILTHCVDTALKIQILCSYQPVFDLISDAFASWNSMQGVLDCAVQRDLQMFYSIRPDLTQEDCYMHEAILFGSIRGLVQAGSYLHIDYTTLIRYQLTMSLQLFQFPQDRIDHTIDQVIRLVTEQAGVDLYAFARQQLSSVGN